MTFTRKTWEAGAEKQYGRLAGLANWLRKKKTGAGFVAYGSIATFTLWPLVEAVTAAAQSGQPLPVSVITAVGAIAGGLGSNVVAGQIQSWYEAAANGKPPTQQDVLRWLKANTLQKDDLKAELDAILEELQALKKSRSAVSPADWQTLATRLQTDMRRLGNLPRFQADLRGDGVIVQGDHNKVAADHSAIVEGDVGGDLVLGAKTVQQITDPTQMSPAALREAYLRRLLAERNQLLLGGIDPKAATADNESLALSAVYTALLTYSSERSELAGEMDRAALAARAEKGADKPKPLSALAQLNAHRHLVLLGDPGSGKSTFVNFVAVCLAGELLQHKHLNVATLTTPLPLPEDERRQQEKDGKEPEPQPWDHGGQLPVTIVLRDFAARGLPAAGKTANAGHLWAFITAELERASLGPYAPLLQKTLLEEGGIFLFDGLDEVPTADSHRLHIKQMVADVARTYQKCRILVTSRTYAYQQQAWRLPAFNETVLAPFSRGQIEQFITRWYAHVGAVRHLDPENARGRAALLRHAVFSSRRLYALAERPLLLTLMASLHAWRGGSLPENREELYAEAVDLLLDLWEQQRIVRDGQGQIRVIQPSLEQWLAVKDGARVRALLNRLAFEAHSSQPELVGTADIAESELVMGLLALSEDKDLQPKRLVEFLSNRAGLLLPRGVGVYTFPHRTFQEYLAACHLTAAGYPDEIAQLARTAPNRWREVALLAGAKAARGSAYALWGLVEALCHEAPGNEAKAAFWGAHLAGQLIVETADLDTLTPSQQRHVDRVRRWLAHVLTDAVLPATERAQAGRHLARLGDPRPEVADVDAMQFCHVPPGDFVMGEGKDEHLQTSLDQGYWLARFPVTYGQYMAFVEDGGYGQEKWWAEAIAARRWQDGKYTWPEPRVGPRDFGQRFQYSNQPVVGVSWFEALAFSRWLTARWRWQGWLPESWQVTLPSEAEWEKAARGGLQIPPEPLVAGIQSLPDDFGISAELGENPAPKRPFTWVEGDLSPELANYKASEINAPSAVGGYSGAASVYGCEEMLGNVFEWTRSLDKPYPYDPNDGREKLMRGDTAWTRVRGGSWYNEKRWSRCAARNCGIPDYGYVAFGFRVVVSPFI